MSRKIHFQNIFKNSSEYAYDSNGNVTRDDNRGISSIEYNALGLPSRISVGSGSSIEYIYSADGTKLGSRYTEGRAASYALEAEQTEQSAQPYAYISEDYDYIGCYEFRNRNLFRVNTPYGYCTLGSYIPYRRDYQGNNRNNADYYAYGLPVQGSNVSDQDPYLYSGKEFYSVKGINIYDFSARTYAPDIARFMQPDPKAGDYHWLSPYSFCGGDPINFVDPDGQDWYTITTAGYIIGQQTKDTDQIFLLKDNGEIIEITHSYAAGTFNITTEHSSDQSKTISSIRMIGNKAGKEVFEALACNTSVEWSLIQAENFSEGIEEENYIGTSHSEEEEFGAPFNLEMYMSPATHFVYDIIHSHPNDVEGPSGVLNGSDDIGFARKYEKIYPMARFSIFVAGRKRYVYFNSRSNRYDFNFNGGALPELEVLGIPK